MTLAIGLSAFTGVKNVNAASVIYNFNSNNGVASTNQLSGDGVTANTATFTTAGQNTASFDMNRAQRDLGNGQANETSTFSFILSIGATPVTLTDLSFINGLDVNSGSATDNYFKWDIAVTRSDNVTASATPNTFPRYFSTRSGETSFNESATLTGLTNLTNVDVTFAFTGEYGTQPNYTQGANTQRWIYLDNVTFNGEAIPEPSAALLGSIGILALLRRRR